jgi:hypothetical protein
LKITLFDRFTYKISKREYTDEGFLRVPGRVARTGIQDYLASELGLDGDPNRIVKVFRPADEVFSQDSLNSYQAVDVTNDHPPTLVDSKNFKAVTVGVVMGAGVQDGDFVQAELIIKDAETIELVESGKAQLSAGYTAEYAKESGTTDEGVKYEFVQRDIKINHVAVVNSARAGSMARIFDNKPEIRLMKITLDNGRAVEVEDTVAAQVEDCIKRLMDAAETEKEKADTAQAKADAAEEENEKLKAKSSDAAITDRILVISTAMDAAKILAGAEFTCDSLVPVEIKRAALDSLKKDVDFGDKSSAYIEALFDVEMEKKKAEDEEEEEGGKKATDSHKQLSKDMSQATKDAAANNVTAKKGFHDGLTNGWKKTVDGGES